MNLFPFMVAVLAMIYVVHISPILSESSANAFIAAMLPHDRNYSAETLSADDLAESIYQNLIKRKLPAQEQIVENNAKSAQIRDEVEREAIDEAKRKGQAQAFLRRMKHANQRRRKLLKMRRLVK